jgi:hypothetical protein
MIVFAAVAAFGGGALAYAGETAADVMERYEATGEARNCVSTIRIESIKAVEDGVLLVELKGGKYLINETQSSCSAMGPSRHFRYSTSQPQLCRGQIVDIVDSYTKFTVGTCTLGDFQDMAEKA